MELLQGSRISDDYFYVLIFTIFGRYRTIYDDEEDGEEEEEEEE